MGLKIGIVGLPNVGKSTLFNALLKRQIAYAANFPFATIEPNVGVVPVPDGRLNQLAEVTKESEKMTDLPPVVNATVEFVDIAGLIAGASKGEGLGNKFLSHIRETDAICFCLRLFKDKDVIRVTDTTPQASHVGGQAKSDFEILKTELDLADLEMTEKHKKKKKEKQNEEELPLFSKKPYLVVLNVDEGDLVNANKLEIEYAQKLGVHVHQVIAISAKIESELSDLADADQEKYLEDLGIKESGIERLTKKAFETLGLITFLTAGVKEVRAWTIKKDTDAQNAAGVIHTDFIKKFIKADVVDFNDFIENGGWKNCREKGKVRSEGRDYIMKDGDVVEFKIGS
ncbi:redox-regulated ATPase YchF [Candidatus Woesebacteria bacterium]|nr:redox-regulated ATPase YchF [Candidatus Woesebacteria bacterium]QQG47311.1 MAG: redox-regulated ATPase YchF [Candidatus Woesebacteria bacterium]